MRDPDIYGFYTCGPMKTYRKWEAIHHQEKTGQHLTWHFNDDIYSAIDWSQEPASSLEDLYRLRAEQLRHSYDYLVIWYSGGADSDAVLRTFVSNDIFVDEIVSWTNYSATGDRYDFCNGEIFNVAIPNVERLKEQWPLLNHRILDICQPLVDFFKNRKLNDDWIYDVNNISAAINAARPTLIDSVVAWKRLADQGKRIAFITGTDKPRLQQHADGHWSFRFIDMFDNSVTPGQQITASPLFTPEFFFWSPESPLIVVKQAHVIKNYLRHAKRSDANLIVKPTGLANKKFDDEVYWLTTHGLHRLIYPRWQPIPYQNKNPSPIFSLREKWFRDMGNTDPAVANWKTAIKQKWQITPNYWKNHTTDMYHGFKQTWSRTYHIGF